jgi:hypothetical protein
MSNTLQILRSKQPRTPEKRGKRFVSHNSQPKKCQSYIYIYSGHLHRLLLLRGVHLGMTVCNLFYMLFLIEYQFWQKGCVTYQL